MSDFKYLNKLKTEIVAGIGYREYTTKGTPPEMEIAYQLKRIADILERK